MRTIPIENSEQLEALGKALNTVEPSVPSNNYYASDFYLLDGEMQPTTAVAALTFIVAVGETNFTLQVIDGEITRVKGE